MDNRLLKTGPLHLLTNPFFSPANLSKLGAVAIVCNGNKAAVRVFLSYPLYLTFF